MRFECINAHTVVFAGCILAAGSEASLPVLRASLLRKMRAASCAERCLQLGQEEKRRTAYLQPGAQLQIRLQRSSSLAARVQCFARLSEVMEEEQDSILHSAEKGDLGQRDQRPAARLLTLLRRHGASAG